MKYTKKASNDLRSLLAGIDKLLALLYHRKEDFNMMNQAEKLQISENREITALRREARKVSGKEKKHYEAAIKELKFKRKSPGLYNRGYYHNVVLG